MTIGTHTLRKTAFLFAIFGILTQYDTTGRRPYDPSSRADLQPLEDMALLNAARHHASTDTRMYYQDAMTRFGDMSFDEDVRFENRVSPWMSIYASEEAHSVNNNLRTRTDLDVDRLAESYVKIELGIHLKDFTFSEVMRVALLLKKDRRGFREKLDEVRSRLPSDLRDMLIKIMEEEHARLQAQCGASPTSQKEKGGGGNDDAVGGGGKCVDFCCIGVGGAILSLVRLTIFFLFALLPRPCQWRTTRSRSRRRQEEKTKKGGKKLWSGGT